jgi:hypothetical protein
MDELVFRGFIVFLVFREFYQLLNSWRFFKFINNSIKFILETNLMIEDVKIRY